MCNALIKKNWPGWHTNCLYMSIVHITSCKIPASVRWSVQASYKKTNDRKPMRAPIPTSCTKTERKDPMQDQMIRILCKDHGTLCKGRRSTSYARSTISILCKTDDQHPMQDRRSTSYARPFASPWTTNWSRFRL